MSSGTTPRPQHTAEQTPLLHHVDPAEASPLLQNGRRWDAKNSPGCHWWKPLTAAPRLFSKLALTQEYLLPPNPTSRSF